MQSEMLPVERPLLSKQLELLDDVLAQGIAPSQGTDSEFYFDSRVSLGGRGETRDDVPIDVDATPHTNHVPTQDLLEDALPDDQTPSRRRRRRGPRRNL